MKRILFLLQAFALATHCFVSATYLEYDPIRVANGVKTVVSENLETLCLHNQATKNLEVYQNQNGSWGTIENLVLSNVTSFTLSKDGKMLSALTVNGILNIYEKNILDTWNSIPEFTLGNVDFYTTSSDGKRLCIKKFNGILQVVEKQYGIWQADAFLNDQSLTKIYYSDDQKMLIAMIEDAKICVFTRPSVDSQWQIIEAFNQLQQVEDFKIAENGKTLCIRTDEKFFIVEQDNNNAWNKIKELPNAKRIKSYTISSDGTSVIIKTDKNIIINDKKEDCWFQTKKIKTTGCFSIASSGKLLAVVQNKYIVLYEQNERTWQKTYKHPTKIKNINFIQVFDSRDVHFSNEKKAKTMIFKKSTKSARS